LELWLDRAARQQPDVRAVNSLTYRALHAAAAACANALAERGIGRGDRVATTLGSVEFAVLLHALPRLGAVLVPLNKRLTPREREQLLEIAQPSLIVEALPDTPRSTLSPDSGPNVDLDDPFAVVFTSGTTGRPKAVELTYRNFEASARANAANLGVQPDDRWLCAMPLFHVGGLSILTRSAIYGTTALVHDGFDVEAVINALTNEDVTLVSLVATQLRRLLDAGLTHPPKLRAALIGGGPVPRDLVERAREHGIPALPTYGMTETCSQIWTGRPLPGVEIRTSADGELLVRGPMVAPGALAEDGWLHTGDRGSIDADGTLHVEGRIADTIVTGGENVSAAEVEEALLAHPAIDDAAVVGLPDPEWGQAVIAFVVAVGDTSDLDTHLRERLAGYKRPKQIRQIPEIPRNAAGKILRGRLPQ
jgi:O-succinylbenzoic acid--CoA ligase